MQNDDYTEVQAATTGECLMALAELELPPFEDERVQRVYAIICDDETLPDSAEHWEGYAARRIVAALAPAAPAGWMPIETAPRDGTRFVRLYYVTVLAKPIRHEMHLEICHRERILPDSPGYWSNEYISIPDHSMVGWWYPLRYPLPAAPNAQEQKL